MRMDRLRPDLAQLQRWDDLRRRLDEADDGRRATLLADCRDEDPAAGGRDDCGGGAGAHRWGFLGHGCADRAVQRRAPDRPGSAGLARARSLHPEQGALRGRALRDPGRLRLLLAGRAADVHEAAVAAQWTSEPAQDPRGRGERRAARPRPADRASEPLSAPSCRARPGAPSWCSATANCRRARTGRR